MAKSVTLIECSVCNKEVASNTHKCTHCGAVVNKLKRSFFGKIIKYSFIIFNIFMAWWLIAGFNSATESSQGLQGAEAAGAAIGTGLGITVIVGIWLVVDIILGLFVLFTRPKA
ncbi:MULTISPECIES: hypothetical protein [Vibrio harveyi group]|uniref:hypothetical protein n=1 Tax=Vibrio harveyi group TaxID=717610 RepID=UPI00215B9333|nr:hypothetical protein [Vibrio alginolyticus]ELJ8789279.1 hypothetical protein [Vibrio parahaemolyticus]MCR9383818.1 hypothetical protein [Vibrio alginolyticus]MCR9430183.1 hypothetical protein [Vibrio alginolyticus]MCR9436618.1 hypothetical protein [Vibrio alginolyticus]